ncbi:hypothetical protein LSAT2_004741 [Lamellibrachia satsuma]|nr:hypothetical protein LSAT2_004741 [Lamellibrachia satsuma]
MAFSNPWLLYRRHQKELHGSAKIMLRTTLRTFQTKLADGLVAAGKHVRGRSSLEAQQHQKGKGRARDIQTTTSKRMVSTISLCRRRNARDVFSAQKNRKMQQVQRLALPQQRPLRCISLINLMHCQ